MMEAVPSSKVRDVLLMSLAPKGVVTRAMVNNADAALP